MDAAPSLDLFPPRPPPPYRPGEAVRQAAPEPLPGAFDLPDLPGLPERPAPETLHPALWLGHQLGRSGVQTVASGFSALDAELPGNGWPKRVLSELLLPHLGVGEIRLLAPCLAAAQRAGRLVMAFDPPADLSARALAHLGIDVAQLLVVSTRAKVIAGSDSLWALEQALKSGHVGVVLAWLPPRLRVERLRRLQLAAHNHDGAAFVLRELAAAGRPTASPLRLSLHADGADLLRVRILKRRGPPLEKPLQLALPAVLSEAAQRRSVHAREASRSASASALVKQA